jgi:hypothetical protein
MEVVVEAVVMVDTAGVVDTEEDFMVEAGEAIMAVIAARLFIEEDLTAMFPSWASEPDSLRVIG